MRPNKKARDAFAKRIDEMVKRYGAVEHTARWTSGKHEFHADYRLATTLGELRLSGDNEDRVVSIFMRFGGDIAAVNEKIHWENLNPFSGKCNIHDWAGGEDKVLAELERRLEELKTMGVIL